MSVTATFRQLRASFRVADIHPESRFLHRLANRPHKDQPDEVTRCPLIIPLPSFSSRGSTGARSLGVVPLRTGKSDFGQVKACRLSTSSANYGT
jgi:hypothetical protein